MNSTGVFATDEEKKECWRLSDVASRTPVIMVGETDLSASAWSRTQEAVHKAALAHGLPEIEGFYGMDADGQFVTA